MAKIKPTMFRKRVFRRFSPSFLRVADQILGPTSTRPEALPLQPIIIAIDGPPGIGKTTFARRLSNHINQTPGLFAHVLQMDWFLRFSSQELAQRDLETLSPSEVVDPSFWYDFDRAQEAIFELGARRGTLLLDLFFHGQRGTSMRFLFPDDHANYLIVDLMTVFMACLCWESQVKPKLVSRTALKKEAKTNKPVHYFLKK